MNNDKHLINAILSTDSRSRSRALKRLYDKCFNSFLKYTVRDSTAIEEAKDVFQEATVILYQNLRAGKFREESSVTSYFSAICKNLWNLHLRKQSRMVVVDNSSELLENEIQVENEKLRVDLIATILQELKADCRAILKKFYYEQKSMKQIASEFDLGSEQAAKNKKARCMKSLMSVVSEKGWTMEHFFN